MQWAALQVHREACTRRSPIVLFLLVKKKLNKEFSSCVYRSDVCTASIVNCTIEVIVFVLPQVCSCKLQTAGLGQAVKLGQYPSVKLVNAL